MRLVYDVGDTNTTAISTINGGYDGQIIKILSKHTSSNTTTFIHGTGNLLLGGSDLYLGLVKFLY
jgi:hypothetical protein